METARCENLRRKLARQIIGTMRGAGYRLNT
jgi:DNA-binding response OmpR family regulator